MVVWYKVMCVLPFERCVFEYDVDHYGRDNDSVCESDRC